MKILVLARNEETYFMDIYEKFKRELVLQVPSTVLYGDGHNTTGFVSRDISEIFSRVGDNFDVIYLTDLRDQSGEFGDNPWTGLSEVKILKTIFKTDIHNYWEAHKAYIIKNGFRSLFCPYPEKYQEERLGSHFGLPHNISVELLPHSADTETYHPYDESKIFDVSVLGMKHRIKFLGIAKEYLRYVINFQRDMVMYPFHSKNLPRILSLVFKDDYPLRSFVDKELSRQKTIKYFTKPHPGRYLGFDYNVEYEDLETAPYLIGKNFARAISSSKIIVAGSSRWRLPLQKTFQGMACKTLVITQEPYGAKELNFVDGWNYVHATKKDVMKKIEYYLNHENEREEIAQNGYDTILKYHTLKLRVSQFVKRLKELV